MKHRCCDVENFDVTIMYKGVQNTCTGPEDFIVHMCSQKERCWMSLKEYRDGFDEA